MNGNFIQAIRGPIMLITLGSLVAMDYAGIYGFWRTWPVLIIIFGVLKLMERAAEKPGPPRPPYSGGPSYPSQPPRSVSGGNVI